jgi:hypothetical protein
LHDLDTRTSQQIDQKKKKERRKKKSSLKTTSQRWEKNGEGQHFFSRSNNSKAQF